ncbi:reverse transcriptase N-terminal domain-containing protein, partial [Bacillus cereus group sp. N21]|uniref:reverse transcriptase N-terminal domain-containing protein n=1 Tax=Bacillus cereus group sp. N21 TaxID=2794591 RepID=UPI0018F4C5EF
MPHASETPIASAVTLLIDWNSIEWRKLNNWVRRIQQRIYRAEQLGQRRKVKGLQRLLMRSE